MRTFSPCWKVLTVLTVEAPAQVLGQRRLEEVDDDVLPLRADVDAGAGVGQIDDDAALARPAASEVDVADGVLRVVTPFGKVRDLRSRRGLHRHRLREGDHHRVAVDGRLVRDRPAQVEDQTRALGALHHVHAAQLALADVLARPAERIDRVRKVECDARRTGDGEVGRHALQRVLGGDAHHHFAPLLRDVECVDAVLRGGKARDGEPQQRAAEHLDGFFAIHRFASNSWSELARSTHSPPLSCTSSFRLIWLSSMAVMTPKFWPM
jgi:hypothetical protein